jgi:BirA family biotin operon repressor/biotin-[acetyl-CoA-carboxylase] ligase
MDEAGKISEPGWQRVLSLSQISGRGRRGSSWQSKSGDLACTWLIPSNVVEECSPGLTQTAIGAVVSDALRCNVKWPNDILTDGGAKLGGVLLEGGTENSRVKVGIGLNRKGGSLDGIRIAGWEDVVGPSRASEVFEMVDAAVASLFEERPSISPITREELLRISWRGLSKSLSRGTHVSRSGASVRPVGLTEDGRLILYCESGVEAVGKVESLSWVA